IKVLVFTVTSAFAGLAGAFYAHYVVVLSPQIADFSEMAKLIIMVVVGGLGSFVGPLIAVTPIASLHLYLAKYGEWDMVIYAFVVIVLMRTQIGGVPAAMGRLFRLGRRGPAPAPPRTDAPPGRSGGRTRPQPIT